MEIGMNRFFTHNHHQSPQLLLIFGVYFIGFHGDWQHTRVVRLVSVTHVFGMLLCFTSPQGHTHTRSYNMWKIPYSEEEKSEHVTLKALAHLRFKSSKVSSFCLFFVLLCIKHFKLELEWASNTLDTLLFDTLFRLSWYSVDFEFSFDPKKQRKLFSSLLFYNLQINTHNSIFGFGIYFQDLMETNVFYI